MNDGIAKWAPLTGLLFIAVLIGAFVLGGVPPNPTDDGVDEIVDFYDDGAVFLGAALQGIAGALLIFFASYVSTRFRGAGARSTATLIMVGAATVAVGLAIDGTIALALADYGEDIDPGAVQALSALWNDDFLPVAMGMLVFLMSFGVAIVRHGELPKWVGWIAIVASLTAVSPAFPVAAICSALLIAISSVAFALRPETSEGATS